MHVYIYDNFVNEKKYYNTLSQIETRITDLGLNGKIVRLNVTKNIQNTVNNEIKRGAKTIIAVGGDEILSKTINAVVKYEKSNQQTNIPLGILPIDNNSIISKALGIPNGIEACNTLSARRIEKIDVGKVGQDYFITQASITGEGSLIQIPEGYSIETAGVGEINIINIPISKNNLPTNVYPSPTDGMLNLHIKSKPKKRLLSKIKYDQSFFSLKKLAIQNKKNYILLDNILKVKPPAEISILPKQLNIIVGKERNF